MAHAPLHARFCSMHAIDAASRRDFSLEALIVVHVYSLLGRNTNLNVLVQGSLEPLGLIHRALL